MSPLRLVAAVLGAVVWASVLFALCLATVPAAWGWTPRVVLSGSMEPAIAKGDVAMVVQTPPEQLRERDVVLADLPGSGGRTYLHRVEVIEGNRLVTRGDANRSADVTPIRADAVHGRVRLVVPLVGWPLLWITDPSPHRSAAGALVASLLVAAFLGMRSFWVRPSGRRRSSRQGPLPSRRRPQPQPGNDPFG